MDEPDDQLTWPSGQRRQPLRERINFSRDQVRAGRALMGISVEALANMAGHWPRDVLLSAEMVANYEAGRGDLTELEHAAICNALYHEGYGVVALGEGGAGEGVRFALPAEKRAEGTFGERRWRPVWEDYARRAALVNEWWAHLDATHGPAWRYDLSVSLEPPFGWARQTNGQSHPVSGEASCAP